MAIAAKRFNFLDRETNISIKDFTELNDNAVYNVVDSIIDTALSNIQKNDALLNALQANINELPNILEKNINKLSSMLENNELTNTLKNELDSAIESISKMDLPDTVKDIFDSLKKLDTQGVKDFFKDVLRIGAKILCNNLDFLKLFTIGFSINKNILSGLIIALLLNWLDRFCKEFTQEEMKKSNNVDKLNMMFPYKGVKVDSNNAFELYTNYLSDYLKYKEPLQSSTALDSNTFLNRILNGDIDSVINNLRNAEISHDEKNAYLNLLNNSLSSFAPNSTEYKNILTAKARLLNTPLISVTRREKNIRYENLASKLGSYIKNLGKADIPNDSFLNLSDVEKSLYDKMISLKNLSANSATLQSTPNDSFDDFDFNSVLPSLTQEEKDYLMNKNVQTDSHRLYDLHPTATVFLKC